MDAPTPEGAVGSLSRSVSRVADEDVTHDRFHRNVSRVAEGINHSAAPARAPGPSIPCGSSAGSWPQTDFIGSQNVPSGSTLSRRCCDYECEIAMP